MEGKISLPPLTSTEITLIWAVLASAFVGLFYGLYLVAKVMRADPGSKAMQDVAAGIQEGARAYLLRQFRALALFIVGITIGLYVVYRPVYQTPEQRYIPLGIALAFLMGSLASAMAGWVGMSLAVRGNVRVAHAALSSFKRALDIAFQAGTVSGMFTVGLGLMGATIIFLIFKQDAMKVLVGFGFGGCLVALFMRVGGGIFTKAADVGADLVGKVEAGIPEDDPRNAATIADNVGDNVGDCAGMAADVFESYEVTLVAAIILAAGTLIGKDPNSPQYPAQQALALKLIIYPLLVRAVGVFASIIGTWMVRGKDEEIGDPMKPINVGFYGSAIIASVGFGIVAFVYLRDWRFFAATLTGIVLALVIGALTHHFTHTDKGPVTEIAHATRTGPATMLLAGFATGLESTVWAILAIAATIFASAIIFQGDPALSAYGIALSGLGLLTTTGFILAMDTYGPISDNANGIFEMSRTERGEGSLPQRIVARLDAVGNVTKALTKGFAIATAVIAAISLFRSFIDEAGLHKFGIQVNVPEVFIGLLIGGAVPFLFSSMAIRAVGRAAFLVVEEVRRQFREIPGIMEFKGRPEYARCVDISTAAAQKELIGPGVLAIATPLLVAFLLGVQALGGYLAGAILTGQLLAVFMANTGGAWDNAKKKIEDGLFGGKGTEFHKAAVIADTVGDPFKDTAGPALNPLIKVMNLVAILVAPVAAVAAHSMTAKVVVPVICVIALAIAVWFSGRGSIVSQAAAATGEAPGEAPGLHEQK
jgi:K(+)-stimulated pyrophosphate-energized sodium pump